MGRGSAKGSSPKKRQGAQKASAKRAAPKRTAKIPPSRSSAKFKSEAAKLAAELKAAQARQAAMAQILEVISSSSGDLKPVFDVVLERATLLCGAGLGVLSLYKGDDWHQVVAMVGEPPGFADMFRDPIHLGPETGVGRLLRGESHVHIADAADDDAYRRGHPVRRALVDIAGARTYLAVPIRRDGVMLGSFTIYRREVRPFSPELIALLLSFASQAAIAIENARLFNETREALAHQTATSEVLQAIGSSMADTQPVFERILDSVERLFEIRQCAVMLVAGDGMLHLSARRGIGVEAMDRFYPIPLAQTMAGDVVETGRQTYVASAAGAQASPLMRRVAESAGDFSVVLTPMLWEGRGIGVINLSREPNATFSEKELALLRTFADQAVIAIQNARLFNDVQARTRDLSESLQQQTATADVLKVISRSAFDLQAVLDTLVESAARLCEADNGIILQPKGDGFGLAASWGLPADKAEFIQRTVFRPGDGTLTSRVLATVNVVHAHDVMEVPGFNLRGDPEPARTRLGVPLLRDGVPVGVFVLTRLQVRPFTDRQIELVQTFAAQAVIAVENARLFNETKEALERQTATADILKVIASSPSDVQPVFDAIVANAARLIGGLSAGVYRFVDDDVHLAAITSLNPAGDELIRASFPRPMDEYFRIARGGGVVQVPDTEDQPVEVLKKLGRARGFRSTLNVPLRGGDTTLGTIVVSRRQPGAFAAHHVDLLQTFADQAVIAIENVRLFNETKEALAHQTATSEVLQAIGSSMADTQPVFERILDSVERLFDVRQCSIILARDGMLHLVARRGIDIEDTDRLFPAPMAQTTGSEVIRTARQVYVPSAFSTGGSSLMRRVAEVMGDYSVVMTPLVWEGKGIGLISAARAPNAVFSEKELALLRTFADQAVIAIENARLFNETQEALERQTATSEVLQVISSSRGELGPVFEAMLENAVRICRASFGTLLLYEGDRLRRVARMAAQNVPQSYAPDQETPPHFIAPFDGAPSLGRLVETKALVHIADIATEHPDDLIYKVAAARTVLIVPMLKESELVGAFAVYRKEVQEFTDKQVELLENFAAQAVIAIENTRLLNELRRRTDDLTEALEQQTATADVLKAIASSPDNVQPVFDAIADRANKLLGGHATTVLRIVGDQAELAAFTPVSEEADAVLRAAFPRPIAGNPGLEMNVRGEVSEIRDTETDPEAAPLIRNIARARGFRSRVQVPLKSDSGVIGAISVTRVEPGAFAEHHVQLLQTFADQAVIAIQNVRLFNETQEALAQQTATAEVLSVISNSVADTAPVFEKILDSCENLFATEQLGIFMVHPDGQVHVEAWRGAALGAVIRALPKPLDQTATAIVLRNRAVLHIPNTATAENIPITVRSARDDIGDLSMAWAPMLRDEGGIGSIAVMRQPPNPFSEKELALLKTFADQAVVAIQNTRLFNETQEALERQTATADILKVIASSPDDVQPVFEAIVASAARLIGAFSAGVYRFVDDVVHLAAITTVSQAGDEVLHRNFPRPIGDDHFRTAQAGEIVEITDTENQPDSRLKEAARIRGFRSIAFVPLKSSGVSIGVIAVTRQIAGAFVRHHIDLLQTFADQAVIAIENVRLFNETKEALEQQTATSEVLEIISSSPGELDPVFQKMLENACRVCDANFGTMNLWNGEEFTSVARQNTPPAFDAYRQQTPIRPHPDTPMARVVRTHQFVHEHDLKANPAYLAGNPNVVAMVDLAGARTLINVPMLKEDELIGTITIFRREVRPFTDKQIALVENFTKQAVIAIENTRLLRELRERTDDLQESLQQQTATADVLKVISRSAFDLDAVLTTLTRSAVGLCRAARGAVFLRDGDLLRVRANAGTAQEFIDFLDANPIEAAPQTFTGRTFLTGEIVHLPDVLADPDYDFGRAPHIGDFRSALGVPLVREGRVEGVFSLSRPEPGGFTEREIELIRTFADQAVIAIENVRLFNEVQARTKELAASLNDLRTAQDRLIQTEKLASLGQLTAGIAHEIKNPLNFVNNFSALSAELTDELNDVLAQADLTGKMREEVGELTKLLKGNLEKVVQHGKRADSIVKNMLLHSREGGGEQRLADINALVDDSLNLAYHGARAEKPGFNIALQRDFDTGAGSAELFPQEISRALLNLISNGFYAATKRKNENGGTGFEPVLQAGTRDLGSSVEIRIRDNGTGIPAEVKEKMFNPFFTTKPAGEGTGLGLSMTHDIIVKQHGGRIDVESRLGEFTEFTIVLPRTGNRRKTK